jgi:proteasome accessory factor A
VKRVYGLETEYGVAVDGGSVGAEDAARALFAPVVAWGRSSNVFTPAGARLYLDVGSHPEYATAECDNLADLLAQDQAGDRVMAALAQAANQVWAAQGPRAAPAALAAAVPSAARGAQGSPAGPGTPRVYLLKNNTDTEGNSYGCHENYQVARLQAAQAGPLLIPFLVSRQLIAGAGKILVSPRGARYVLSQRADQIVEATSSATTRSRPMINTRDEPHADGRKYRRLHVIVGDSSMAPATTMLKTGATDLVLRGLEEGCPMPSLELDNPVAAIREIAHNWERPHPVKLADGRSVTALELQEAYLEAVAALAATDWDHRVVDLWTRALAAWRAMDFEPVATEIDWVIKHRLIQRYQARTGASLLDPRVQRLELAYHDVGPAGLAAKLQAAGAMTQVTPPGAAARAVLQPPATTRAAQRGRFIRAARAAGRDYTVDWVRLKLADGPAVSVWDPLDHDNPAAAALIDALGDPGPPGLRPAGPEAPPAPRPAAAGAPSPGSLDGILAAAAMEEAG